MIGNVVDDDGSDNKPDDIKILLRVATSTDSQRYRDKSE